MKQMTLCITRSALPDVTSTGRELAPFSLEGVGEDQYHLINRNVCDAEIGDSIPTYWIATKMPQLLGYAVVRHGDQILTYLRPDTGDESRLHALRSIGFGGHIDIIDVQDSLKEKWGFGGSVGASVSRELEEELGLIIDWVDKSEFTHVLVDNSNDVGSVHVGLPVVLDIIQEDVSNLKPNHEILDLRWVSVGELLATKEQYENWSQMLIGTLIK